MAPMFKIVTMIGHPGNPHADIRIADICRIADIRIAAS
jgi:hypothetical protein